MTSFVNLMGNDVWSPLDISRRVQAIIRSQFTQEDELKAARLARQATKTDAEAAFIASVDAAIASALAEGAAARSDMALLNFVLQVEQAMRILAAPPVEQVLDANGQVTNAAGLAYDNATRVSAQAEIDAASDPVKALVALRNPAPVDAQP